MAKKLYVLLTCFIIVLNPCLSTVLQLGNLLSRVEDQVTS